VERLGLTPTLVAGFAYSSPLAKLILSKIEDLIRLYSKQAGFLEMELPSVVPFELVRRSGVAEQFESEIIPLAGCHNRLILSATTEEPLLEYLQFAGVQSYRDFPIRDVRLPYVEP